MLRVVRRAVLCERRAVLLPAVLRAEVVLPEVLRAEVLLPEVLRAAVLLPEVPWAEVVRRVDALRVAGLAAPL